MLLLLVEEVLVLLIEVVEAVPVVLEHFQIYLQVVREQQFL
tara:strand:+ start:116 stop:238 length:123 start_codon:yes stop_codon:yes gene_type:complete